jgi:hypothetical protein
MRRYALMWICQDTGTAARAALFCAKPDAETSRDTAAAKSTRMAAQDLMRKQLSAAAGVREGAGTRRADSLFYVLVVHEADRMI